MSKSMTTTYHVNTLNTLFFQLTTSNFRIAESERVKLILEFLSDSYDQRIISIINDNVVDPFILMMPLVQILKMNPNARISKKCQRVQSK
jgi:hypothetical protein